MNHVTGNFKCHAPLCERTYTRCSKCRHDLVLEWCKNWYPISSYIQLTLGILQLYWPVNTGWGFLRPFGNSTSSGWISRVTSGLFAICPLAPFPTFYYVVTERITTAISIAMKPTEKLYTFAINLTFLLYAPILGLTSETWCIQDSSIVIV